MRRLLIFIGLGFFTLVLILPLVTVFYAAFKQGVWLFWQAICDEEALAAIFLTLKVALITLPINLVVA